MPQINIYPHYLKLSEEEEQILQSCIKHTNAGIKKTVILALKQYQDQMQAAKAEETPEKMTEMKSLIQNLNNSIELNNFLMKRILDI